MCFFGLLLVPSGEAVCIVKLSKHRRLHGATADCSVCESELSGGEEDDIGIKKQAL